MEAKSLNRVNQNLKQIADGIQEYNREDNSRISPIKKLVGGDGELIVVTEFKAVVGDAINDICRIAVGLSDLCIGVLMFDSLGKYDNITLVIKSNPKRPRHIFTAYSAGLGLPAELATNISKQLYEGDTKVDYEDIAYNIINTMNEEEYENKSDEKLNQIVNIERANSVPEVLDIMNVD